MGVLLDDADEARARLDECPTLRVKQVLHGAKELVPCKIFSIHCDHDVCLVKAEGIEAQAPGAQLGDTNSRLDIPQRFRDLTVQMPNTLAVSAKLLFERESLVACLGENNNLRFWKSEAYSSDQKKWVVEPVGGYECADEIFDGEQRL
jgi:hypothetical protein